MNKSEMKRGCPFCQTQFKILTANGKAIALKDKYPIVKDHILIVSLRHIVSFFELSPREKTACLDLLNEVRDMILKKDNTVTGFNIGINDGVDAGQTIFHCHIHVIPRRKDDVVNPRGGIRNIITKGGNY